MAHGTLPAKLGLSSPIVVRKTLAAFGFRKFNQHGKVFASGSSAVWAPMPGRHVVDAAIPFMSKGTAPFMFVLAPRIVPIQEDPAPIRSQLLDSL
jgi:hypothetical protein